MAESLREWLSHQVLLLHGRSTTSLQVFQVLYPVWTQPRARTSPKYLIPAWIETICAGLILSLRMRIQTYRKEVQEEDEAIEEAPVPKKMCGYVSEG
jgi:hypothetical protein